MNKLRLQFNVAKLNRIWITIREKTSQVFLFHQKYSYFAGFFFMAKSSSVMQLLRLVVALLQHSVTLLMLCLMFFCYVVRWWRLLATPGVFLLRTWLFAWAADDSKQRVAGLAIL